MVHQFRRDISSTFAFAQRLVQLSKDQGFPMWLAGGTIMKGWALSFQDRAGPGVEMMESGLADWRSTGAEVPVPYYLGLLAEGYALKGQPGKGLELLSEAIDMARSVHGRGAEIALLHHPPIVMTQNLG